MISKHNFQSGISIKISFLDGYSITLFGIKQPFVENELYISSYGINNFSENEDHELDLENQSKIDNTIEGALSGKFYKLIEEGYSGTSFYFNIRGYSNTLNKMDEIIDKYLSMLPTYYIIQETNEGYEIRDEYNSLKYKLIVI